MSHGTYVRDLRPRFGLVRGERKDRERKDRKSVTLLTRRGEKWALHGSVCLFYLMDLSGFCKKVTGFSCLERGSCPVDKELIAVKKSRWELWDTYVTSFTCHLPCGLQRSHHLPKHALLTLSEFKFKIMRIMRVLWK